MAGNDEHRLLRERMDALTAANVRLLRRVADLEARLARLDGSTAESGVPPVEERPLPEAPPRIAPEPVVAPVETAGAEPSLTHSGHAVEHTRTLETRVGLAWVNRIAVLTCVLAAAFFFKYASDSQWIGPEVRVATGVGLGLAALAFSTRFFRRGELVVTQGLAGIGVSLLYLSVYAAFNFYQLLGHPEAFGCSVAVTAIAGMVAWRYHSQTVAALAALGGYATPLLLASHQPRPMFLMAYTMALTIAAVVLARWRTWAAVERISLAGGLILTAGAIAAPHPSLAAGIHILILYGLFAASPHALTVKVAQFIFPAFVPIIWKSHPLGAFVWLFLFASTGLYVAARRAWPSLPWVSFVSLAIQTALFASEHPDFHPQTILGATALFVLFFGWLPWRSMVRHVEATRWDLITAAANAVCYFGLLYYTIEGTRHDALSILGWLAVGLGLVHAAAARWLEPRDRNAAQLYFGIAAGFAILTVPLQFSRFGIAMAWALEGAALAWVAARTQTRAAAVVSQFVLLLSLPFLENAPLLAWVTVAVCWLLASQWLPGRHGAAATYIGGHLLLLAGISIELSQWAVKSAAEQDAQAVSSTVVSVTAALYALLLVIIGVVSRTSINRVLGLALIGLVIAKLYLRDVWELRMLYRVIAFAALGGLLLTMSMLYSRFRERIERLLLDSREDKS